MEETNNNNNNFMELKKIAIRFCDNDFYFNFRGVLENLANAALEGKGLNITKEQLCFLINQLSLPMYIVFQNTFKYNNLAKDYTGHFKQIKKYLQITEEKLLINEEVDNFLIKTHWDNAETFILDLTLYANQIYYL
jgi:hypothetical protein